MWLYQRVMSPNDADGMANSVDPDQTAPLGAVWGAVWSGSALFAQAYLSENLGSLRYAVCLDLSKNFGSLCYSFRFWYLTINFFGLFLGDFTSFINGLYFDANIFFWSASTCCPKCFRRELALLETETAFPFCNFSSFEFDSFPCSFVLACRFPALSLDVKCVLFAVAGPGELSPSPVSGEQWNRCEPPHDKTNKMTMRPGKTQISLDIRPVWSESSLCAQWLAKDPSFLHVDSRCPGWSESLLGAHAILLVLSWGGSGTVMILSFQTDRSGQTVNTQIRLILKDRGLHCLSFSLHLLAALLYGKATMFKF